MEILENSQLAHALVELDEDQSEEEEDDGDEESEGGSDEESENYESNYDDDGENDYNDYTVDISGYEVCFDRGKIF